MPGMFLLGRKVALCLLFLFVGTAPSRPAIAGRVALELQLSIWNWRRQIKLDPLTVPKAGVCSFDCKCFAGADRGAEPPTKVCLALGLARVTRQIGFQHLQHVV